MKRSSFSFGHKPLSKPAPEVIHLGYEGKSTKAAGSCAAQPRHQNTNDWSLQRRVAALLAIIAVPAMAAPGDFGQLAGGAPTEAEMISTRLQAELKRNPAMPFERPGMSFPGSAFFFLDQPPQDALITLPELDALAEGAGEAGREVGQIIDAGPGANPFFGTGGIAQSRAQSCLAQAIWYEAASESEAGQRAVAQVVLNRVKHPSWPNSVCGVVYQGANRSTGCQFTFTCDGSLRRNASGRSWDQAKAIADQALSGSVYEPIGYATHYHTLWVNPYWASRLDHVGTIGAHRFYRNRGAGGRSDAFNHSYAGAEPGTRERVTAPSSLDMESTANPVPAAGAGVGSPAALTQSAPSRYQAPASTAALTGPGSVRADQNIGGVGQVREDYSRSGQWKSDAARAALLDAQMQGAKDAAQTNAQRQPSKTDIPR